MLAVVNTCNGPLFILGLRCSKTAGFINDSAGRERYLHTLVVKMNWVRQHFHECLS